MKIYIKNNLKLYKSFLQYSFQNKSKPIYHWFKVEDDSEEKQVNTI